MMPTSYQCCSGSCKQFWRDFIEIQMWFTTYKGGAIMAATFLFV